MRRIRSGIRRHTVDEKNNEGLKAIIEALVFASPEPLTPKQLYKLLEVIKKVIR